MYRVKNLLIFKLGESPNLDSSLDFARVKQVLSTVGNISLTNIVVKRLGKPTTAGFRPVSVTLSSPDDVFNIMRSRKKLLTNLSFSTNKTSQQRDHLKKLWTEVDRFDAKDLSHRRTVKYINGVPTISDAVTKLSPSKNSQKPPTDA